MYIADLAIDSSPLFAGYPDTHRYRLGVNYQQLPINRPISGVHNYQRDGAMTGKKSRTRSP